MSCLLFLHINSKNVPKFFDYTHSCCIHIYIMYYNVNMFQLKEVKKIEYTKNLTVRNFKIPLLFFFF